MSFPRYPAYKDSAVEWLGEVPAHWRIQRLKWIASAFPSNVDKKAVEGHPPVLLCNYTDVYYNDRIVEGMDYMAATASIEQIERFTLRRGDVIITKDSETADDIAIAAYVPADLPGVVCGYHLTMIRAFSAASGLFLKWLFGSRYVRARFEVAANGLTRVGLGQYAVNNVDLPVPPLPEQCAIGAFLDRETARIDVLVAEQERLIELLREKRQAVISHAVTKGLDPTVPMKDSGVEWLGALPAHWTVKRLDLIFAQEKCLATVDPDANYQELGVRSHGRGVFHKDPLRGIDLGDKDVYWVQPGALVFNIVFAWEGAVAVTGAGDAGLVASHRFPMFIADPQQAVPEFYKYFLTTDPGIRLLDWHSPGAAGRNRTLDRRDLFKEPVPVPPVAEQAAICRALAAEFSRVDALIAEAVRVVGLLRERRAALISAAVTGQIDIRGLDPEVAA